MIHLPRQAPAGEAEHDEHQRDDHEHGRDAAQPALEPGHRRRQDEREQDGERDRHEHRLRPVEDDDDQHAAGERDPRLQACCDVSSMESHASTVVRKALAPAFTIEQPGQSALGTAGGTMSKSCARRRSCECSGPRSGRGGTTTAPRLGASLAYYTLFAIAPILLVATAIAGMVFGAEAVRGEIVGQLDQLVGREGALAVQSCSRAPASGGRASSPPWSAARRRLCHSNKFSSAPVRAFTGPWI